MMANVKFENISVDKLQHDNNLKECDSQLAEFIAKTFDWEFNSEYAPFTVKNGISYLDSLCSVRFDKLGRSDKCKLVEIMEMVLKKTNELLPEAKAGLSEVM